MARVDNNNRLTPDAVQNYDLNPSATVVDKQSKYTPQLEDAAKLKQTAEGLSKLAKGIADIQPILARQAKENAIEAVANTEAKNRSDWAEVSKNIDGMAKFNPYNQEMYRNLRAKANMEEGVYKLAELEAHCADLNYEEFEAQRNAIQNDVITKMNSEGLQAKHTAGYLTKFQDQSAVLKKNYLNKRAEKKYQIVQNQLISSTSKDIATLTFDNPNGFIAGWNEALKGLETNANNVGMDNTKQYELVQKTISQYLADNVDDIDAEEFIIAVGQTTINGQPLSDFDPNYTTSMKQLLMKAKNAKYEVDSMDLKLEKLRLEKAELAVNAEMLSFMADPNKTDSEILNKAYSLIEENQMEGVGMAWLHRVAGDKQTLLNLRTAQTNPNVYSELMRKSIIGELSQEEILTAMDNKQLNPKDANALNSAIEADIKANYSADLAAIKDLYLDSDPVVELSETQKNDLVKMIYDANTDTNLTKAQKAEAIARAKKIADGWSKKRQELKSKNPMNLLKAEYVNQFKVQDQSKNDASRALAKIGLFHNQLGFKDGNVNVTSTMQAEREVTLANGKVVKRRHNGTDVATYLGRQVFAPANGTVLASGYEASMGNYILFKYDNGGYIKLMHLQQAGLPKAGAILKEGQALGHVGNTGDVTTTKHGVLHVECFDEYMRLVDPMKFIKGK